MHRCRCGAESEGRICPDCLPGWVDAACDRHGVPRVPSERIVAAVATIQPAPEAGVA